jgi:hypothetical protein
MLSYNMLSDSILSDNMMLSADNMLSDNQCFRPNNSTFQIGYVRIRILAHKMFLQTFSNTKSFA